MSLLQSSLRLFMAPLFLILIYGLSSIFFLNSPVYLLTKGLLCQTPVLTLCCCSRISDTRMLNNSICLNRSGDWSSKWSNVCCHSKVSSLDLTGDRSIGNWNSVMISTTYWSILVPSTGPAFQTYSANNMHCDHWWSLPFSADFILHTLFKNLWNPSFLIALWLFLATACIVIRKVSWKFFLDIPEKVQLHPPQSFWGAQMEHRSFQNPIVQPGWCNFFHSSSFC